jgi:hypothetical protein
MAISQKKSSSNFSATDAKGQEIQQGDYVLVKFWKGYRGASKFEGRLLTVVKIKDQPASHGYIASLSYDPSRPSIGVFASEVLRVPSEFLLDEQKWKAFGRLTGWID